jgi:hypothetical protein
MTHNQGRIIPNAITVIFFCGPERTQKFCHNYGDPKKREKRKKKFFSRKGRHRKKKGK